MRAVPGFQGLRMHVVREPVSGRSYTVLVLETQSGVVGYGECARATEAATAHARRILAGSGVAAYEVIDRQLEAAPELRAAVNMALLDIAGKIAKAPVFQLLGGPTRSRARAMTRLDGASDEELAASLRRAKDARHRAFLVPAPVHPGRQQEFVNRTLRRLDALEAAAGDDCDFVLDAAGGLTPAIAAALSRALEGRHLLWFDEPVPVSNLSVAGRLSAESVTPLGFGQSIHDAGGFQDLLREGAIDVLRPDIRTHGVSGIRRLAALAETYYTAVAPHHDGGPVATAAALHLAACLPNFYIQQIPLPAAEEDRRMRASMTRRPVEVIQDGFAALPDGPGLGVEVDERILA